MLKRLEDELIFEGPTTFLQLSTVFMGKLEGATPSVLNVTLFESPSGSTTVTDFLDGADGQTIRILGNGNLTASNNANIKTNTGADKVLAANKVYTFTHINGVWYEGE